MLSENSKQARALAVNESRSPALSARHQAVERDLRGIGAAKSGHTALSPKIGILKHCKRLIEGVLRLTERAT